MSFETTVEQQVKFNSNECSLQQVITATTTTTLTNDNILSEPLNVAVVLAGGDSSDKVWNYFRHSDNDRNKAMCLLCSKELLHDDNKYTSDSNNDDDNTISSINGQSIATSTRDRNNNNALWNHLKIEHSIEKTKDNNLKTNGIVHKVVSKNITSKRHQDNQLLNDIVKKSPSSTRKHNNNIDNIISHTNKPIMTSINRGNHHHKHNNYKGSASTKKLSSTTTTVNSSNEQNITKLRRGLDLVDYSDFTLTSMKPSPSSPSLSRNLISRLNELSSPVARKLKFWNKKSFQVNQYDPSFKVIYLGNLGMQFLSKDEQCLEKPLNTLWNNYLVYMKTEIVMRLTICNSGLKAITRQHGLTQYWSNRLVYCFTHKNYPKIFSWIYRHEGKKMRQELRCHAVFCPSPEKASKMVLLLNQRLACALQEFKREKKSREPPSIMAKSDRLQNLDSIQLLQQTLPRTVPLRRQILAKGLANFRPPLDRSKSAPKLTSIREEDYDEEYDDDETEEAEAEDSHDEYEFEQSFGDKDDEDDEEEGNEEYDEDEIKKFVDNLNDLESGSTHKIESDSLITTANEVTSNSGSIFAAGDNPYEQQQRHASPPLQLQHFDRTSSIRLSRRSSRRTSSSSRTQTNKSSSFSDRKGEHQQRKEPLPEGSPYGAGPPSASDSLCQMLTKHCHLSCADGEEGEQCQTSANNHELDCPKFVNNYKQQRQQHDCPQPVDQMAACVEDKPIEQGWSSSNLVIK